MHCTFQCFWYWTVAAHKPTLAQIAGLVNNYANGIHPGRARSRVQLRACQSTTHDEPERTLKLFDRVYAPLTAALLHPIPADQALPNRRRSPLDRLYQRLTDTLDHLLRALGLAFSPPVNENKILVDAPITA